MRQYCPSCRQCCCVPENSLYEVNRFPSEYMCAAVCAHACTRTRATMIVAQSTHTYALRTRVMMGNAGERSLSPISARGRHTFPICVNELRIGPIGRVQSLALCVSDAHVRLLFGQYFHVAGSVYGRLFTVIRTDTMQLMPKEHSLSRCQHSHNRWKWPANDMHVDFVVVAFE